MADFGLETDGFGNEKLQAINDNVVASVDGGGRAYAEKLKKEIEETSPVDTGRYKADWHIEEDKSENRIYIVNSVPYAKHLVFPNSQFVGSSAADDPSAGILHNVRGIVHSEKSGFAKSILDAVRSVL